MFAIDPMSRFIISSKSVSKNIEIEYCLGNSSLKGLLDHENLECGYLFFQPFSLERSTLYLLTRLDNKGSHTKHPSLAASRKDWTVLWWSISSELRDKISKHWGHNFATFLSWKFLGNNSALDESSILRWCSFRQAASVVFALNSCSVWDPTKSIVFPKLLPSEMFDATLRSKGFAVGGANKVMPMSPGILCAFLCSRRKLNCDRWRRRVITKLVGLAKVSRPR